MARVTVTLPTGQLRQFCAGVHRQLESAALVASHRAAFTAKAEIRAAMRSARLGGLANAVASTSDKQKNGRVYPQPGGFSASGVVYARSGSDRTAGALEAYTRGATIRPIRGRWLWIPTRDIPARIGRYRTTPARWAKGGLNTRIGPLVFVPGSNPNEALLVVENVTLLKSGRRGSALRRKSRVTSKRNARDKLVAFIGIRKTSRRARVDVEAILRANQAKLPELFAAAVGKH